MKSSPVVSHQVGETNSGKHVTSHLLIAYVHQLVAFLPHLFYFAWMLLKLED